MKEIVFIILILLSIFDISILQGNFSCGQDLKEVSSVKECLSKSKIDKINTNNTIYCCMLTVNVGSSYRSICVPVNNTNYDKLNKTNNLSPYKIINNKYEYNLYCKEESSLSQKYMFNYILYIIIVCLIY